jgi:hypothetical protein
MANFGTVDAHPAVDQNPSRHGPAGNAARRALVPLRSARPADAGLHQRNDSRATAPFLTHLLATAQGLPQTRGRCRAEPNRAIMAYADRMHVPPTVGRAVRESR